ncbi:MAG: magnesium and cobalt transport protein CorA, partial [Bacteroidetes bacterium]|nr:magnesium and cobalt transport protein CorA [Bacteroidota bacterium]
MNSQTAISSKVGLPPGALVHIGEHKSEKSKISIIDFLDEQFEEKICHDISE